MRVSLINMCKSGGNKYENFENCFSKLDFIRSVIYSFRFILFLVVLVFDLLLFRFAHNVTGTKKRRMDIEMFQVILN